MIITSKENNCWQEGKEVSESGTVLSFGEEKQTIRGFGTCFSELGAIALNTLTKEFTQQTVNQSAKIQIYSFFFFLLP